VYVLSADALLDKFIFDNALRKLSQRRAEWEQKAAERAALEGRWMQNRRSSTLAAQMYSLLPPSRKGLRRTEDWSLEDLEAIGNEGQPSMVPESLDDVFYISPDELLQCLQVTPEKIPQCATNLPRLKGKSWYLTKQVWTFEPEEMHDLEFQPALPALAAALPSPGGGAAAAVLWQFDASAVPILISSCKSTNPTERINASSVLQSFHDQRLVEPLLTLLKDEVPLIRFHAVTATMHNWDPCFADPLIVLLRDPHPQIRQLAAQGLRYHEHTNRAPVYLELLNDPNPDVQWSAFGVLAQINRKAIPRADLLRLLGNGRADTLPWALALMRGDQLQGLAIESWSDYPLSWFRLGVNQFSSAEAAPLTTNQFTMARLLGLSILRHNADSQAVELALPLLRDTNSIVRHRAFDLLQSVSDRDIPQDDPAKWEQWWAANKATFIATKPPRQ
jgi:HEAT repeat protein